MIKGKDPILFFWIIFPEKVIEQGFDLAGETWERKYPLSYNPLCEFQRKKSCSIWQSQPSPYGFLIKTL